MENFDGVYEMRLYYTVTTSEGPEDHRMTFDVNVDGSVDPGDDFDTISLQLHSGSSVAADAYLNATFLPLILECFSAQAEFSRAELWQIPEGTYNATFLSALELGEVGVNPSQTVTAQQTTFTFRTAGGNTGRIQLMESAFAGSARQSPPFASSEANDLTLHLVGLTTPIVARDNTRFVARIAQNDGQNEKLWRKRFRE